MSIQNRIAQTIAESIQDGDAETQVCLHGQLSIVTGTARPGPVRLILSNNFLKWWERRVGQCEARATPISFMDLEGASNNAMPGPPPQHRAGMVLGGVVGLAKIHQGYWRRPPPGPKPFLPLPFRKLFLRTSLAQSVAGLMTGRVERGSSDF